MTNQTRTDQPGPGAARRISHEPRWPAAAAIIVVVIILHFLPQRVRLLPVWAPYALSGAMVLSMLGVSLSKGAQRWRQIERVVILSLVSLSVVNMLIILAEMIRTLALHATEFNGIVLFASSVALWATNVLYFSLIYWLIDRGGPEARLSEGGSLPDWRFPQDDGAADVAPGWRPVFMDYLFLAYSTATAFSPTDASPLTRRAKALMMLQSTISLLTLVVVASRAINILGN